VRWRLDLTRLRLRAVWLLILPFYIFASPATILILWGAGVSSAGLALRAWAAGSIQKDRELAMTGPYAHIRNPLFLGSFILGVGVTIAGGQWVFGVVFLVFFLVVYRATVLREVAELEARFGESYRIYAAHVPSVLPRFMAHLGERSESRGDGFSRARYMRNREWEAALGAVAAFGALALKMEFWP